MKKALQSPRLYLLCAFATIVPTTILQILAYLKAYSAPASNYFSASSLFPKLSVAFALLGCLLAAVSVFLSKQGQTPYANGLPEGRHPIAASLGFLGGALILLLSDSTKLAYAASAFLILAAIYHLALAFHLFKETAITALIGFSTVIGCILTVGYYYFDASLEMNAPVKVHVMMGLLFTMLYYTAELRFLLGNGKPKILTLLSASVVSIGALTALPLPIAFLAGRFDQLATTKGAAPLATTLQYPAYLAGAVILLGVTVTILWRTAQIAGSESASPAIPADLNESTEEDA